MDRDAIIERLVADAPSSLRPLEAVAGPVGPGVLTTELAPIDIHHQDPRKVTDPRLARWRLRLDGGRAIAERALKARFGEPQVFAEGERRVLGFASFYLFDAAGDALELLWAPERPGFVFPARVPRRAGVLEAFLQSLPGTVAALTTIAAVDDLRHSLPSGAGVAPFRRGYGNRWRLALTPPFSARDLCLALGWRRPFAISGDVHQVCWYVALGGDAPIAPRSQVPVTAPSFGPWEVRAELTERPEGDLPSLRAGPGPAYDLLHHAATVWCLEFTTHARGFSSAPDTPARDALLVEDDLRPPVRGFSFHGPPPRPPEPLRPGSGPSPHPVGPVMSPPVPPRRGTT
jgi:hypothetical protein